MDPDEIAAHGAVASRMMARDQTRFDAACEVMAYLKEIRAPYYYIHRMNIVLFGNEKCATFNPRQDQGVTNGLD